MHVWGPFAAVLIAIESHLNALDVPYSFDPSEDDPLDVDFYLPRLGMVIGVNGDTSMIYVAIAGDCVVYDFFDKHLAYAHIDNALCGMYFPFYNTS